MAIDIHVLFPQASPEASAAFEVAPKSLLAVGPSVDYRDALSLNDPRYVPTTKARAEKFGQHFLATFGYRPQSGEFVAPASALHVLFFGHVGCGKSTELTQLCDQLHDPARYWVVQVKLTDIIDPNDVRYSDVWLAVAQELVAGLQRDEIPVQRVVLDRLERWFSERVLTNEQVRDFAAEVKTGAKAEAGIPLLGKLFAQITAAVKTASTHRESLRTVVRNTYAEFVAALNQLIDEATAGVQQSGHGQRILFAIDGTDRFREEDWHRFFVEDANQLTQVKCIAVYTAPMALKASGARLDLYEPLVLPMIKLHEFDDAKTRRGVAYDTMRAILLKRCHHSLFESVDVLDALIDYSGGHLRDALRLLAYACIEADGTILDGASVRDAARRLAGDYRAWLRKEDFPVLVSAERDPENDGASEAVTRLVDGGALLEYNNGTWRQPHPVIGLLSSYQRARAASSAVPDAS